MLRADGEHYAFYQRPRVGSPQPFPTSLERFEEISDWSSSIAKPGCLVTLRSGHGSGAGVPRIEVLPVDELPAGMPAPARPAADRDNAGKFVEGPGTAALARGGAKARHESRQLRRLLGLWTPDDGHEYADYHRLASEWRDAHLAQLSATVGGGQVGPGPASLVSSAAIQLGASRYLADLGAREGNPKLLLAASQLSNDSRQNLLAAHELAAKEAKARPKGLSIIDQIRGAGRQAQS